MNFVSELEIAKVQQSNGYMLDRDLIKRQMEMNQTRYNRLDYAKENDKFRSSRGFNTIHHMSSRESQRFILAKRCSVYDDTIVDSKDEYIRWDNILFRTRNKNRRLIEPVNTLTDLEKMEMIICSLLVRGDI